MACYVTDLYEPCANSNWPLPFLAHLFSDKPSELDTMTQTIGRSPTRDITCTPFPHVDITEVEWHAAISAGARSGPRTQALFFLRLLHHTGQKPSPH